jgi:hypothetical protein
MDKVAGALFLAFLTMLPVLVEWLIGRSRASLAEADRDDETRARLVNALRRARDAGKLWDKDRLGS